MSKPSAELSALRNLISEAETILATTKLPQGRAERALELLRAALALTDDLANQAAKPAAALGAKGGNATKKANLARDPDYYKRIAAMRKKNAGGRPRKKPHASEEQA